MHAAYDKIIDDESLIRKPYHNYKTFFSVEFQSVGLRHRNQEENINAYEQKRQSISSLLPNEMLWFQKYIKKKGNKNNHPASRKFRLSFFIHKLAAFITKNAWHFIAHHMQFTHTFWQARHRVCARYLCFKQCIAPTPYKATAMEFSLKRSYIFL